MSEARALELGYTPKAVLKAWSYSAVDPFEDLLLGPTFATSSLLKQAGLTLKDVDVVEFHEAFAGQVRERDIYVKKCSNRKETCTRDVAAWCAHARGSDIPFAAPQDF